jgi:hypothetical protein
MAGAAPPVPAFSRTYDAAWGPQIDVISPSFIWPAATCLTYDGIRHDLLLSEATIGHVRRKYDASITVAKDARDKTASRKRTRQDTSTADVVERTLDAPYVSLHAAPCACEGKPLLRETMEYRIPVPRMFAVTLHGKCGVLETAMHLHGDANNDVTGADAAPRCRERSAKTAAWDLPTTVPRVHASRFERQYAALWRSELCIGKLVFDASRGLLGMVHSFTDGGAGEVALLTRPPPFAYGQRWPVALPCSWFTATSLQALCDPMYLLTRTAPITHGTFSEGNYQSKNVGIWTAYGHYKLLEVYLDWAPSPSTRSQVPHVRNATHGPLADITITGLDTDGEEAHEYTNSQPPLDTMCTPRLYAKLQTATLPMTSDPARRWIYYNTFRGVTPAQAHTFHEFARERRQQWANARAAGGGGAGAAGAALDSVLPCVKTTLDSDPNGALLAAAIPVPDRRTLTTLWASRQCPAVAAPQNLNARLGTVLCVPLSRLVGSRVFAL